YKNVMVVEEDIDIRDYEQLDWAFAFRVNAGENDLVTFPGSFGSLLDPSTNLEERDALRYGSGKWTRLLIDATRNWEHTRWGAWNNSVYPPVIVMTKEMQQAVASRWKEYGLDDIQYKPTMMIDYDEDLKERYALSARPTEEKDKDET
ncbi:MAG: UbiD family decarboxylase, partial [Chloroflexi bacterium]|nr:UbiD family decarboxylase [Chloroflexota bacterium]